MGCSIIKVIVKKFLDDTKDGYANNSNWLYLYDAVLRYFNLQ